MHLIAHLLLLLLLLLLLVGIIIYGTESFRRLVHTAWIHSQQRFKLIWVMPVIECQQLDFLLMGCYHHKPWAFGRENAVAVIDRFKYCLIENLNILQSDSTWRISSRVLLFFARGAFSTVHLSPQFSARTETSRRRLRMGHCTGAFLSWSCV
jgi:hypothetical protein